MLLPNDSWHWVTCFASCNGGYRQDRSNLTNLWKVLGKTAPNHWMQEGQPAEHFEILDFAEKMVINAWTSTCQTQFSLYDLCIWYDGMGQKTETWCRNLQLSIFYLRCEISDQVLLPHPVLSELLPAIAAHALTLAVEPCEGGGCYNHQNVVGFVWLSESAMVRFRLKIHGRFHWSSGSLQQGASDSLVWLEESRFACAKRQVLAALALTASGIATVGHSRVAPARCSTDTTQTYTDPLRFYLFVST